MDVLYVMLKCDWCKMSMYIILMSRSYKCSSVWAKYENIRVASVLTEVYAN